MNKTAIQFGEGDVLLDWTKGSQILVRDGKWVHVERDGYESDMNYLEQAILDKLTEIVKPLRKHKIGKNIYREDGWATDGDASHGDDGNQLEWVQMSATVFHRDLFTSWGWPIPSHMEDK
jgi:phytoene dehydrogenase-like protein